MESIEDESIRECKILVLKQILVKLIAILEKKIK